MTIMYFCIDRNYRICRLIGVKVYYNSACPVCKAGIENQRCLMPGTAVEWLDVHADPQKVAEIGSDLPRVRERLHVKTDDGVVHVGADALAVLFMETKGRKWLARLLRNSLLHPVGVLAYNGFARCLYLWNRSRGRW
jgi:predicted DCC family thiol-disulfide oxidoreductase YuxK